MTFEDSIPEDELEQIKIMTFEEWVDSIPENEREQLSLSDAWNAAVKMCSKATLDNYGWIDCCSDNPIYENNLGEALYRRYKTS